MLLTLGLAVAAPLALAAPAWADSDDDTRGRGSASDDDSRAFASADIPPVIGGLPPTQAFDPAAIGAPFSDLTLTSAEASVTATVTWDATALSISNLPDGSTQGDISITRHPGSGADEAP